MDSFLQQIATTSATFVGKAAYSYAASLALRRLNDYVEAKGKGKGNADEGTEQESSEQENTFKKSSSLSRKLSILIPIIDKIYIKVAKGSSDHEATLALTNDLLHLLEIADSSSDSDKMNELTDLVDDLIPLLSLHLSSLGFGDRETAQTCISYSRLLKASAALVTGDAILSFSETQSKEKIQIGPIIPVRVYTLFEGSVRKTGPSGTWKEEFRKCSCSLARLSRERRKYQLNLLQNLNDGMYHDISETPSLKTVDIESVSKMYYSSSGALLELNEDGSNLPVLVVKILHTEAAGKVNDTPGKAAGGSRVEWLAMELDWTLSKSKDVVSSTSSASESEDDEEEVVKEMGNMNLGKGGDGEDVDREMNTSSQLAQLCLLEYMIRLAAMESREGISHTKVPDSLFNMYFEDGISSTSESATAPSSTTPAKKKSESVTQSPLTTRTKGGRGGLIERFLGGSQGFLDFLKGYFAQYSTWEH